MTEETAITAVELARETLLGDLMQLVIDELKAAPDVWQKLSEHKQDALIHRVEQRTREAVRQVVEMIASNGRTAIPATLEQVTVKDGIKGVITVSKTDPSRHDLTDAVGRAVMIVVADPSEFNGGAGAVQADKDQPELPLADPRPVVIKPNADGDYTDEGFAFWWTALGYHITESDIQSIDDEQFDAQAAYAKGESDEFPEFMNSFRVDDLGGSDDEQED